MEYSRYTVYLFDPNRNNRVYIYLSNLEWEEAVEMAEKSPYMHVGIDYGSTKIMEIQ